MSLGGEIEFRNSAAASTTRTNLGLGWPALTNTNAATSLLGFTTNGEIVYNGTNDLMYTNGEFKIGQTGSDITRIGQSGMSAETYGFTLNWEENYFEKNGDFEIRVNELRLMAPVVFDGTNAAINAATTRTNLGLGATNYPTFAGIEISGLDEMQLNGASINAVEFGGELHFEEQRLAQDNQTVFAWDTNSFAVTPAATFATNVSIAGSLSVGSFTTTTPSTWALDATQTAAATNGVLTLPSNGNVIRLTNNNAISSVTNGVLGAFYYLINQSGTNVVISNSATITARGATNITLGANESATLISTTATNATAH
jgi:hypothetical protein